MSAGAQTVPRPPVPKNDQLSWISPSDYPPAALRAGVEGTVGFRLSIDVQGAVTACEIILSSGSALLDQATCAVIPRRARFRPGSDAQGNPAAGIYTSRVRWIDVAKRL